MYRRIESYIIKFLYILENEILIFAIKLHQNIYNNANGDKT